MVYRELTVLSLTLFIFFYYFKDRFTHEKFEMGEVDSCYVGHVSM